MPRYLISFDDGSMDHIPVEDWPEVSETSHAVVQEMKAAGVWIFGGGVARQIENPPMTAFVPGSGASVMAPLVLTMVACLASVRATDRDA